jgi:multicomponent Na+:H+ antiporter subunit E
MKKNFLLLFTLLFVVWLLLNASLDTEILISGFFFSLILAAIFGKSSNFLGDYNLAPKSLLYTIAYVFVFFFELLKSNFDVAIRVLSPKIRINPGIVEVKTKLKSKTARIILANSITLTPGTITVDVKDESLFVHWIDVTSEDVEKATEEIVHTFENYLEVMYG